MPQTQQTQTNSQVPSDPDTSYTAVDPKKQPLEFIIQNKDALSKMSGDKAMKFIDMAFRRFALPKYQKAAGQFPLQKEEIEKLRLQFAARMYDLPFDPVTMSSPIPYKPGAVSKAGAALTGAGAGVLGGIRTIADLNTAINKHLGPIGEPSAYISGRLSKAAGEAEGKAYEEAKTVSPDIASASAAVGHQIPAAIAAEGAGSLVPKLMPGAPTALKAAAGGAKGAMEGAAYGAAQPGADPMKTAIWGGVLGVAFPLLARTFGLSGRSATTTTEGAAGAVAAKAAPTSEAKPTLESLKAEIEKQRATKKAASAAKSEALKAKKAGTTVEQTAARQTKAEAAQATAQAQAAARSAGTVNPTASAAVTENPNIKVSPASKDFPAAGGGINVAGTEKAMKQNTPSELAQALRVETDDLKSRIREGKGSPEEVKQAEDRIKTNEEMIKEYDKQAKKEVFVQKVEAGKLGKKVRAKEGQPASPAQQAADRERMAQRRAEGKAPIANREITGGGVAESIAQHVEAQRAKFSVPTIGIQHIPEIEEAVKEMEGGDVILKEMQKYRRKGQINDDEYVGQLVDWLRKALGGE